jgi:two-component system chemotaxis response regulator CheV
MSDAANSKKGILSENGTSEFEIVEFSVGKANYGIHVTKVREVINPVPITQLPNSHPYVDGIFTLRGQIMPLVNLSCCLGVEDQEYSTQNIIVSELNNYFVGFLVNEVSRIHRVSRSILEPPPDIANSESVVGIIKMGEKIVILLDFEKIVAELNPQMDVKSAILPQGNDALQNLLTW